MTRAAVLAGVGAALPPRVVTNDELAQRLDTSDEWIRTRTGIRQRHVVDPGTATGDLAERAGRRALASAAATSGRPAGADLLILATTTPDRPCPATAPDVAARLGLGGIPAYDVNAVCSGFLYALAAAQGHIAAGLAEHVLVVAADTFSTLLDPRDRTTLAVFGDGAGAVLLRAGEHGEPGALLDLSLGSDGTRADLITVRAGGSARPLRGPGADADVADGDRYFSMIGGETFREAVLKMTESSREVLGRVGWDVEDVDAVVGHQANLRILHAVAEQLDLPTERLVANIDRVGNTAAASIPLALADAVDAGRLTKGDHVLVTAYGGGATWGAGAFEWPGLAPAPADS
ncbi:beta-ketoacyl-ACP synthase III [Kitasatospora sp. NPDC058032]|uniref:beta-ketoacyl-ACP synthase III n=1 Tax=unclassified Kitasatospora TaxID=2633591 RepID=UPI0033ADBBD0